MALRAEAIGLDAWRLRLVVRHPVRRRGRWIAAFSGRRVPRRLDRALRRWTADGAAGGCRLAGPWWSDVYTGLSTCCRWLPICGGGAGGGDHGAGAGVSDRVGTVPGLAGRGRRSQNWRPFRYIEIPQIGRSSKKMASFSVSCLRGNFCCAPAPRAPEVSGPGSLAVCAVAAGPAVEAGEMAAGRAELGREVDPPQYAEWALRPDAGDPADGAISPRRPREWMAWVSRRSRSPRRPRARRCGEVRWRRRHRDRLLAAATGAAFATKRRRCWQRIWMGVAKRAAGVLAWRRPGAGVAVALANAPKPPLMSRRRGWRQPSGRR